MVDCLLTLGEWGPTNVQKKLRMVQHTRRTDEIALTASAIDVVDLILEVIAVKKKGTAHEQSHSRMSVK